MTQEQVETGFTILRKIGFIKENISEIEEAIKKIPVQTQRYSDCYAMINDCRVNLPVELGMSLLVEAKEKYLNEMNNFEKELSEL
jgi:hypothetical protein